MKTELQRVVFRKYKSGQFKNDIIALFPDQIINFGVVGCYELEEQHGAANYSYVISKTVPAKPNEYAGLLKKLKSIGYDLQIVKRARPDYSFPMKRIQ